MINLLNRKNLTKKSTPTLRTGHFAVDAVALVERTPASGKVGLRYATISRLKKLREEI